MHARTLAYKALLLGPIFYVGFIAIRARVHIDSHPYTACTVKQQNAIAAYRKPFIAAASFKGQSPSRVDRVCLRNAADLWIEQAQAGTLQPLTPVGLDDYVRDGIKQQIFRASTNMTQLLIGVARLEAEAGNVDASTQDLVRAIKLSEVLKLSDPYAVAQAGIHQRTALKNLEELQATMAPATKLWLRDQLKEIRSKTGSLEPMVRLICRLFKDSNPDSADERTLAPVHELLRKPRSSPQDGLIVLASLPRPSANNHTSEVPIVGLLRMSGISQENWLKCLDAQIEALGTTLVVGDPKHRSVVAVAP